MKAIIKIILLLFVIILHHNIVQAKKMSTAQGFSSEKPVTTKSKKQLIKQLSSRQLKKRISAVNDLAKTYPNDVKVQLSLITVLNDSYLPARNVATEALKTIHPTDKSVIKKLHQCLSYKKHYARMHCAWVLKVIKPKEHAIHLTLVKNMTSPNWHVRATMAEALAVTQSSNLTVHTTLAKYISNKNKHISWLGAWTLGKLQPKNLKVHQIVVNALNHKKKHVRTNAAWALGVIKPDNLDILVKLTKYLDDPHIQHAVMIALQKIRTYHPVIINMLADLISHQKAHVQSITIDLLGFGRIDAPLTNAKLTECLNNAPYKKKQARCAWALGMIKPNNPHILTALTNKLNDPNPDVRLEVAIAINNIQSSYQHFYTQDIYALLVEQQEVEKNPIILQHINTTLTKIHQHEQELEESYQNCKKLFKWC